MIRFTCAASLVALVLFVARPLDGRLFSAGSSPLILDDADSIDVAAIARIMCEPKAKRDGQISRLSSVDRLVEFFDQQVSGESHELFKCKQQHSAALRQLQKALNASKENVCSDEKLALIEDFHNKFVSRHVEHKKSREEEQREAAPQLLRLFFMHYAMEVDAVCRRSLIEKLESDLKQKFGEDINEKLFELTDRSSDSKERAPLSAVFQSAMRKFADLNPAEKCEDVLMVWDLIENSRVGEKLARDEVMLQDEVDPKTGEPIRMMVKVRSRGFLNEIKEHCHYNLKPIYSKAILPLIKLADLGYSNTGARLKSSEHVKRWYSVTQMCEIILPVKYYEDPSLGRKDVVVIARRDAAGLEGAVEEQGDAEPKVQLVYEPGTNSMVGLDRIASVAKIDSKKLVKSVKSNLRARARAIGRTVIRLVRKLRNSLKLSLLDHIFFSKPTEQSRLAHSKSGGKEDKVDVTQNLSKSLESISDEDIEELEDEAPSRMLRLSGEASGQTKKAADAASQSDSFFMRRWKMILIVSVVTFIVMALLLSLPAILAVTIIG